MGRTRALPWFSLPRPRPRSLRVRGWDGWGWDGRPARQTWRGPGGPMASAVNYAGWLAGCAPVDMSRWRTCRSRTPPPLLPPKTKRHACMRLYYCVNIAQLNHTDTLLAACVTPQPRARQGHIPIHMPRGSEDESGGISARAGTREQRADTVACAAQGPGGAASTQRQGSGSFGSCTYVTTVCSALCSVRENVRCRRRAASVARAGRCPPEIKLIYATPGMDRRVSGTRCSRATHACTCRIYVGCS